MTRADVVRANLVNLSDMQIFSLMSTIGCTVIHGIEVSENGNFSPEIRNAASKTSLMLNSITEDVFKSMTEEYDSFFRNTAQGDFPDERFYNWLVSDLNEAE